MLRRMTMRHQFDFPTKDLCILIQINMCICQKGRYQPYGYVLIQYYIRLIYGYSNLTNDRCEVHLYINECIDISFRKIQYFDMKLIFVYHWFVFFLVQGRITTPQFTKYVLQVVYVCLRCVCCIKAFMLHFGIVRYHLFSPSYFNQILLYNEPKFVISFPVLDCEKICLCPLINRFI